MSANIHAESRSMSQVQASRINKTRNSKSPSSTTTSFLKPENISHTISHTISKDQTKGSAARRSTLLRSVSMRPTSLNRKVSTTIVASQSESNASLDAGNVHSGAGTRSNEISDNMVTAFNVQTSQSEQQISFLRGEYFGGDSDSSLDSRQRKQQHTERLEDDKKHYTSVINELEEELVEAKMIIDEFLRKEQQYQHHIENMQLEKEVMVNNHTVETGELRKMVSVLKYDASKERYKMLKRDLSHPETPYQTQLEQQSVRFDEKIQEVEMLRKTLREKDALILHHELQLTEKDQEINRLAASTVARCGNL